MVYRLPSGSLCTRKDFVYGLVDSPASVVTIDMSEVIDDEYGDYINDPAAGYLAAPRASERDQGVLSMSSVGPGQDAPAPGRSPPVRLELQPQQHHNVRPQMGPYGMVINDTPNVGENPYSMVFSPDGNTLGIR